MKKSILALLGSSALLMGATCTGPESPPSAVETKTAVEQACSIPEPQCSAPAFNSARKEQAGDVKLALLRAEGKLRENCLQRYREALQACKTLPPKP